MRIPLTPLGVPELLLFAVLFLGGASAAFFGLPSPTGLILAVPLVLSFVFVLNFFRDPNRVPEGDEATVIAPADGKVTDIISVPDAPFVNRPCRRIGIFLSVFDVHVNRAPLAGRVEHSSHRPGKYLDARDPLCSAENEAHDLGLEVTVGKRHFPILVRQIAGLIARRIICRVPMEKDLERGERYGMIKFGSRTEVFIPEDALETVLVEVGAHVKGGRHALARVRTDQKS